MRVCTEKLVVTYFNFIFQFEKLEREMKQFNQMIKAEVDF